MTGRKPTSDWLEEEDRVYVKDIDSKGAEISWAAWGTGIWSVTPMACVSSFFSAPHEGLSALLSICFFALQMCYPSYGRAR